MANITPVDNWTAGVYQWADGDVLDGGPDSLEVLPVKQLANRSVYQRLRNVTPWDGALAEAFGYPVGACVMHAGVSWRAKLDNSVEPGTDPGKWERWGYSESELNARLAELLPYGVPIACPNSGPISTANKTRLHKSALGEYWIWLGDAWRVISGHHSAASVSSTAVAALTAFNVSTFTLHRPGLVSINVHANLTGTDANQQLITTISVNGAASARDMGFSPAAGWVIGGSASHLLRLVQGDVIVCSVMSTVATTVNWGVGISYVD
jgi:hypothetical protein